MALKPVFEVPLPCDFRHSHTLEKWSAALKVRGCFQSPGKVSQPQDWETPKDSSLCATVDKILLFLTFLCLHPQTFPSHDQKCQTPFLKNDIPISE